MRPPHMAAMGTHLQKLSRESRASLLTNLYLFVKGEVDDEKELNDFRLFFEEMLIGVSEEAQEQGVEPKTLDELLDKIRGLPLSGSAKNIAFHLVEQMRPPEFFEI